MFLIRPGPLGRALLTFSLLISEDFWVLLSFPSDRNNFQYICRRVKIYCDRCEKRGKPRNPHEFVRKRSTRASYNAPLLNGFSKGIFKRENGPLRHSGKLPIKVRNGPLRRGNASLTLIGSFRALCHGGKRPF